MLAALCLALPAHASGWLRAESEHHVVYAELDEQELRELVQVMEDFRRMLHGQIPPELKTRRKLHVYIGKGSDLDWARIERRVGSRNAEFEEAIAAGLYFPRNPESLRHPAIFFELAHYHMESGFLRSAPEWVMFGFAMVFKSTCPDAAGRLVVGGPDIAWPLRSPLNEAIIAERLTTPWPREPLRNARDQTPDEFRQAREIMRQLLFDQRFAGQLDAFLDAYNAGQSLEQASGLITDRAGLVEASARFNNTRRPPVRIIVLPPAPPAEIAVRPLGEDEAAVLFARYARIIGGADMRIVAERLARETRRFPDSAPTWYEYAAAEFARVQARDFGGTPLFRGMGFANGELIVTANRHPDTAAWEAVNRALALNPDHRPAQRLKAEILMARLVREGKTEDADGFEQVRALLRPIAQEPEREPLAAALYHQSYVEQGIAPPPEAFDWLGRAFVANAGIEELRYAFAVALSRRGDKALAEKLLTSLLNSTETGNAARRALAAAP